MAEANATAVADAIARVRDLIADAADRAGREPDDIRLVVVTKDVAVPIIREALDAGATDLGENRAQELTEKAALLADQAPRWHFIGTLQRNKVRAVAGHVVLVHSVHTLAIGRALGARAAAAGAVQDALLEVNVAGEATKHGFRPEETADAVGLLGAVGGLRLRGLMTIAPAGDAAVARAAFRGLRELRDRIRPGGAHLEELSMGMTGDFEAAIEEGATLVRVGTAIFGERPR